MELGIVVKDKITGIRGTLTGIVKYITGCDRGQVEYVNQKGDRVTDWFDMDRLEPTTV